MLFQVILSGAKDLSNRHPLFFSALGSSLRSVQTDITEVFSIVVCIFLSHGGFFTALCLYSSTPTAFRSYTLKKFK